jgi:hypothetical protein
MTVSSIVRKAGPFIGNNVASVFPFSFKVFSKGDVKVLRVSPSSVSTPLVLDSDYSVQLNANQDTNPGGWVTYPLAVNISPLATDYQLVILGDLSYDQETDITNSGGFYPQSIEDMVDRATIQIQQLAEIASRALVIPEVESTSPVLPSAQSRANTVVGFDAVGNMLPIPLPASVGAGDLKNESWTAGTDFVIDTSTSVPLSRAYGTKANLGTVVMDGLAQDPNTYSLTNNGLTLQFDSAIPAQRVWCVGGTTLSTQIPPDNSVSDAKVAVGSKLINRILGLSDVRDNGAVGGGTFDCSAAFSTPVPHMFVADSGAGDYLVGANTTVTANLTFLGGTITVPAGVTLTLNGTITAPHKVLFKGAGTVVINGGWIDVAWFDGADASAKTAFACRGIQNTNGTGKVVVWYPPSPSDAWAVQSPNSQWGYSWNVTTPIDLEQVQTYTVFLSFAGFVATQAMDSVFLIGDGATKCDGVNFPVRLKIDGGNGLAKWAMRVRGASHMFIDYMEAYYCGGIAFTPNGNKQCSDIKVGFLDTGALYNQAILFDGTVGANNTNTDIEIGFVSSTGFQNGHAADSVVKIGSNCNAIKIGKVAHRAVSGDFQDATQAVVLVTNGGTLGATVVSPRYGIDIGPIINGSTVQTAECVVVADASNGATAKMTGITIAAGSQNDTGSVPGGSTISLNYTVGAIVQGLPGASTTNTAQKVTVNSTCADTQIYGVIPSQVVDGGTGTLINGRNYSAITAIAPPGSGVAWVNNNHFPVMFQVQGATTMTNVVLTRGTTSVTVADSGTAGAWVVLPGDNIAVSYTGAPAFNYVPI